MQVEHSRKRRFGRFLGGIALIATAAQAQDAASGRLAQLDVAPGLRYSSGDGGTDSTLEAATGLNFQFSSATRASVFDISADTQLSLGSDGSADGLDDPVFRLTYGRESRDTALTTTLRYRRVDLGEALRPSVVDAGTLPDAGALPDTGIVSDADIDLLRFGLGSRTDLNATVSLAFGRTAPFGGSLSYGYDRTSYDDTIDVELMDSTVQDLNGQLNFRVDPRITARVTASQRVRDVEGSGGVDETDRSVGLGAALAVTPVLSADVSVGYDVVDLRGSDTETDRDGFSAALSLDRDMPNGSISTAVRTRVDSAGRRTSLQFGRDLALSKLTTLGFGLGLSQQDNFGIDPLYRLNVSHTRKRLTINGSVDQGYSTNDFGESVRDTGARLSVTQALTRRSSLRTSASFRDREVLNGEDDLSRLDLSAAYEQGLTEDWSAVASYARSLTFEDGEEDRTADSIFLGLQRSFAWRP